MGVIYIFANPSIPDYVKIGYTDDPENRLRQLNADDTVPAPFCIAATYETDRCFADLQLHGLIDLLNLDLKIRETTGGRIHRKEFFRLSPEDACRMLLMIAEITGTEDRLKLWPKTGQRLHQNTEQGG